MSSNLILNCANKPVKIAFWSTDEFLMFIVPWSLLTLIDRLMSGIVLGFLCFYLLKWMKHKFGDNALAVLLYWYMPTPKGKFRIYMPSFVREYIG